MDTIKNVQDEQHSIDIVVGERTHQMMWKSKVTNKTLGATLSLDPTAIGKKLRAEQKFSLAQLATVAAYLNTTVAYLVGETENPHPENPDEGNGASYQNRTGAYSLQVNRFGPDHNATVTPLRATA